MAVYLTQTQWFTFFKKVGLSLDVAADYAVMFWDNRIQISMLPDLTKDNLRDMGIKPMADIMYILKSAKNGYDQVKKERANVSPNKITVLQWMKFFTKASLPETFVKIYANIFFDNRIDINTLKYMSDEHLKDMGVDALGDRIAILKCAKSAHFQLTGKKAARGYMNLGPNKMALIRKKKMIQKQGAPAKRMKSTVQSKEKEITETVTQLKDTGTKEIDKLGVEESDAACRHISKTDIVGIKSEDREELPTPSRVFLKRESNSNYSVKATPSISSMGFDASCSGITLPPNVYNPESHDLVAKRKRVAAFPSTACRNPPLINPVAGKVEGSSSLMGSHVPSKDHMPTTNECVSAAALGNYRYVTERQRMMPHLPKSGKKETNAAINSGVSHINSVASLMRTSSTVEHQHFIDRMKTLFPSCDVCYLKEKVSEEI